MAETTTGVEGSGPSLSFVGTATTLLRCEGLRVLTDPNFLHRGERAYLGHGLSSRRLTDPAWEPEDLAPVDAVLLSHLHGDHWDRVARRRLDRATPILTTPHAARRLQARQGFRRALGLATWESHTVVGSNGATLTATALPGRHAPRPFGPLLPPVMGSLLEFRSASAQVSRRVYLSGDTLVFDGLDEIRRRIGEVDRAVLHLGGTTLPGGLMVTMDARQGAEALTRIAPRRATPIHYDDYTVFRSPLSDFVREVERRGWADRVDYVARGAGGERRRPGQGHTPRDGVSPWRETASRQGRGAPILPVRQPCRSARLGWSIMRRVSTTTRRTRMLHGHRTSYLEYEPETVEDPEVLVLLHGIANDGASWTAVLDAYQRSGGTRRLIVPDLLGHGASAAAGGDFSLGAYANRLRDLLAVLGYRRVTLVGHSLGGAVAWQFAYQFPELSTRLVLVASGSLGRTVSPALRIASLPGGEYFWPVLAYSGLLSLGVQTLRLASRLPGLDPATMREYARHVASLNDRAHLDAFVDTVRAVITPAGQRVDGSDRLYLAKGLPMMILWGRRDRVIPVGHGLRAASCIPHARLVVFERSGHFPHADEPDHFVELLTAFCDETKPAALDVTTLGPLLAEHEDR